jgi:hypothetical protein
MVNHMVWMPCPAVGRIGGGEWGSRRRHMLSSCCFFLSPCSCCPPLLASPFSSSPSCFCPSSSSSPGPALLYPLSLFCSGLFSPLAQGRDAAPHAWADWALHRRDSMPGTLPDTCSLVLSRKNRQAWGRWGVGERWVLEGGEVVVVWGSGGGGGWVSFVRGWWWSARWVLK